MQLHPRTHCEVIRLLADRKTPGFGQKFITFDEDDVFDRVTAEGNNYFGEIEAPESEFSDPNIAQAYLDLIQVAIKEEQFDAEKEDALMEALLLPDVCGEATAFSDLYSNVSVPSDIPALRLPPILDPVLGRHALLKRRKWKLEKFKMAEFLDGGALQAASEQTRRMFWKWLCRNERRIVTRDRAKLADLVIWPIKAAV